MAQALHSSTRVGSARNRGFTLIEMMIVVVIVGILATLAVVGYRKLVQSSHVTEATNTVQSIRVAQEAYHAETLRYASDISTNLTSDWYPRAAPDGQHVTMWGTTDGTNDRWSVLPLHVDGPVMFGYATMAGTVGVAPPALPTDAQSVTLPASPTTDWFVIDAMCDIDGSGTPNTYVLTTSWSNQVFTFNEGQ
jgi:type IV pilus assembly protein PilA